MAYSRNKKDRTINSTIDTTSYHTIYRRGYRQVVKTFNTRRAVGDSKFLAVVNRSSSKTRNLYTNPISFYKSDEVHGVFSLVLAVIVILFLAITVIRVGRGMSISDSVPTFTGFLETVVNAPVISPTLDIIPVNFGSWLVEFQFLGETVSLNFDFLRVVVESLLSVINFVLWLVQNLYLVAQYIFYFVRWVFQM